MKNLLLYIFIIFLLPLNLSGQDTLKLSRNRLLPDHLKVQFAGNIGFISIGTGYSFLHSNLQTSFFYSYIPKGIEDKPISTVSLKNSMAFLNVNIKPDYRISTYLGIGLSYSGYRPIQTLMFAGAKLYKSSRGFFKGKDIYFEVGTTGLYLNYIVNNETVRIKSILNYSFGMSFYFKNSKK